MASRKPEAFTDVENRALRSVLRTLREQNKWNQTQTGQAIGIGQQAASQILNSNGGFARPTALRLARLCGFDSPESMLADLGALNQGPTGPKTGWEQRDFAATLARRAPVAEEAILRVQGRYEGNEYWNRPTKWWLERYLQEDRDLEEERKAAIREAPKSSPAVETKPRKKKKGAA